MLLSIIIQLCLHILALPELSVDAHVLPALCHFQLSTVIGVNAYNYQLPLFWSNALLCTHHFPPQHKPQQQPTAKTDVHRTEYMEKVIRYVCLLACCPCALYVRCSIVSVACVFAIVTFLGC